MEKGIGEPEEIQQYLEEGEVMYALGMLYVKTQPDTYKCKVLVGNS